MRTTYLLFFAPYTLLGPFEKIAIAEISSLVMCQVWIKMRSNQTQERFLILVVLDLRTEKFGQLEILQPTTSQKKHHGTWKLVQVKEEWDLADGHLFFNVWRRRQLSSFLRQQSFNQSFEQTESFVQSRVVKCPVFDRINESTARATLY